VSESGNWFSDNMNAISIKINPISINLLKTKQMKTPDVITAQMDEIVFEHRNKSYGAYFLRKIYNKHLARAMFISTAILLAGLAYPLVSSYNIVRARYIPNDGGIVFNPNLDLPDEPPLPPLPPPPPNPEIAKQLVFVAPDVVPGDVAEDAGDLNMDRINESYISPPVDVSVETPIDNQPVIIETPEAKKDLFIVVEEMPEFAGGEPERLKYLAENIQYPQQALDAYIQGTIYAQFVVDSKGNITDVKILRGIGGGCDEEALRVIKMMPQWHPGRQNGKTVRVLYNMPIIFKISG
jgi:protein TonB